MRTLSTAIMPMTRYFTRLVAVSLLTKPDPASPPAGAPLLSSQRLPDSSIYNVGKLVQAGMQLFTNLAADLHRSGCRRQGEHLALLQQLAWPQLRPPLSGRQPKQHV